MSATETDRDRDADARTIEHPYERQTDGTDRTDCTVWNRQTNSQPDGLEQRGTRQVHPVIDPFPCPRRGETEVGSQINASFFRRWFLTWTRMLP